MNTLDDPRVQILIAHGSPLVAVGLAAAFESQRDMHVFGSCSPGVVLQAVASAPSGCIIVADYEAGMSFLTQADQRNCRVLIVTDADSEVAIRSAVELGAAGYLPMTCTVDTIMRAVRSLHRGGTMIDPAFISRIAVSLASPALTKRELEVLALVMEGLSNKAIASRLKRSVGTAKSHVKAILAKLDAATRAEAVAVAQRRGLLPRKSLSIAMRSMNQMPARRLFAGHSLQIMAGAED